MPNTPNVNLPYPALSDAPNIPSHLGALAQAVDTQLAGGAQLLGFSGDSTNQTSSTVIAAGGSLLNWASVVIVNVTVPVTTRKVLLLAYSQMSTTVVGNVEAAIFRGPAASAVPCFTGLTDPRIPNPTTVSYLNNFWGIDTAPPAGAQAYALRAKNNAAGSFTSFAHGIAAFLI